MRSWSLLARVCASGALLGATPAVAKAQAADGLIPAIQVDGRGHGHGVGMAQDGALAMGKAGSNVTQILGQFYPGTSLGKATGNVRVPVFSGDNVVLAFPEGGEVRGSAPTLRVPPGGSATFTRDGGGTRVKVSSASAATTTTSTTTSPATTTTTSAAATTTTTQTTLLPQHNQNRNPSPPPSVTTVTTTTTSTTMPPAPLFTGALAAVPDGNGRVGVVARNRRYRGTMEIAPLQQGLRFVNQVGVETYLRGMGEVRNPSWPAAGLQAQAIAARTYALRAMAAGGELCETQRCQVYIGSDAEYAAMDNAVAATNGQVLLHGKSLASAVYSANAGGHSATPEEGFGMPGNGYPYLRAAPYRTEKSDEWTVTIALRDVARRLNYRGDVTSVRVDSRGPSGRATAITLIGTVGEKTVGGLEFDASLGLRSTLFSLRVVMASKVASVTGGSVLQAPPEEASAIATEFGTTPTELVQPALPVRSQTVVQPKSNVGFVSLVGAAVWGAVVVSAFRWRRAKTKGAHYLLS